MKRSPYRRRTFKEVIKSPQFYSVLLLMSLLKDNSTSYTSIWPNLLGGLLMVYLLGISFFCKDRQTRRLTKSELNQVKADIRNHKEMVGIIRFIREKTGWSLVDSKQFYDQLNG